MHFILMVVAAAPALSTLAEQTDFTETGRFAEVETLCGAFPRAFPGRVTCDVFGTTPFGRRMRVLVASADGTLTPEAAGRKRRPVVMLQAGIHAGEIDGKDAGFWLLRELLEGKTLPGALSKVTLVFVPVFNVDGHERFGPNHRPNQNGPKNMGWRVTAENLNLNRDFAKADAPETQALLKLLHRWDPVLFADLHVTDGAKFQPDVSVTLEPQNIGPEPLRTHGKQLRASLFRELETKGHQPLAFYPSFVKDDDPSSGFAYEWPPPRFANAYWAANNRFGLLVETHSWKDYKTRVRATFDVCVGLIRMATEQGPAWLAAAREADHNAIALAGKDVVLLFSPTAKSRVIDFLGYAYKRAPSDVSKDIWVQYDDSKPEVWKVPLRDELAPALSIRLPTGGWVIPPPHARWVAERLALHGVVTKVLSEARSGSSVDVFQLAEPKYRPTPSEGRMVVTKRDGSWSSRTIDLPKGTLFVPAAQPKVELAAHLLDPAGPDSFLAWGFFNAHLEQKEYLENYVTEAFAREVLKDPAVRAEFDAALKEPAFAQDSAARLRFFAKRHPSFDPWLNVVPVYRVEKTL